MKLLTETIASIAPPDAAVRRAAHDRLSQLTMPFWALGRLMDLAEDLAAITGCLRPSFARRLVIVAAGDHGVVAEGVSRYPADVTPQMVANFLAGGAGINALAAAARAELCIVNAGVSADLSAFDDRRVASGRRVRFIDRPVRRGTQNIARGPATTRDEAARAVELGIEAVRAHADVDLFATGDMGIGNTTPSAAIAAVFTGRPVADVTGRGTGIDDAALAAKRRVVETAIACNAPDPADGLGVLAGVGGLEIGAIAGIILGAASCRRPVLIDGFISGAGALIAQALCPHAVHYTIAAHVSEEPGHRHILCRLGRQPLLDLGLRLGEGTGAALAIPLVDAAARLLTDVRTFAEAAVSGPAAP